MSDQIHDFGIRDEWIVSSGSNIEHLWDMHLFNFSFMQFLHNFFSDDLIFLKQRKILRIDWI